LLSSALAIFALAAPAGARPRRYELDGLQLRVPHPIIFEPGKATLAAGSGPAIAFVAAYLADKPYVSMLRIEVHSDASDAAVASQALTERRALAVAMALVREGADCKRLIAVGFGATKPIADNATAEGRAANRRTVFENAAFRGRPIGGAPIDGGGRVGGDPCTGNS
jgi:OOP family OmpA-OmpF porin